MKSFKKKLLTFAFGIILALFGLATFKYSVAKADGYSANCGASAVVACGVYNQQNLDARIRSDARALYSSLGGISTDLSSAKYGVVYPDGTVKVNGNTVATNAMTFGRVKRSTSDTPVTAGDTTFWKHSITGAAIYKPVDAHVFLDADGRFKGAIIMMCGNPVVATPIPKPVPPPAPKPQSIICSLLKVTVLDQSKRTVSAQVTGTPQNTTISGYKIDFGDGSSVNKQSAEHTYANYGKYTITGYVTGMVDGKSVTVSGPDCVDHKEFVAPPPPAVQSIRCEVMKRDTFKEAERYIKVSLIGSAQNTTIDGYKINFGDESDVVFQQTAEHTYAKDGTYTIIGSVSGKIDGTTAWVSSVNCTQKVTFTTPVTPTPTPTPEPTPPPASKGPEELVNTGPGAIIGTFTTVSVIGALGHRLWAIRRAGSMF